MKYLLLSDVHGSPVVTMGLFDLLERRGWTLETSEEGHPYLHHEGEKLIFVGDNSDRGAWSLPVAYLALSSMMVGRHTPVESSVITIMGNHDLKIQKYFLKDNKNGSWGFAVTLDQLENPIYQVATNFMRENMDQVPYWFIGRKFIAAHAFWESPMPSEELAIYGPVVKDGTENSRGYMPRISWWEQPNETGKTVFFGHYHMRGEGLDLGEDRYCLDNHDGGVHIVAEIDDDTGKVDIHHLKAKESKLLNQFSTWL